MKARRLFQSIVGRTGKRVATIAILLLLGLISSVAYPQSAAAPAPHGAATDSGFGTMAVVIWALALACSVAALVQAMSFYKWMKNADPGTPRMEEIAGFVRTGAYAYLRQQYKVVAVFFVVICLLFILAAYAGVQSAWVPVAFLTGGLFSGLAGYFGMRTATLASNRTAAGAQKSLNQGLQVAFRAGAVMGLTVVGLGLLDICLWFGILYWVLPMVSPENSMSLMDITVTMLCFGMGASSQALFARVGGGIFTKAADVGADLVGKVEHGIPEDDARNPTRCSCGPCFYRWRWPPSARFFRSPASTWCERTKTRA